MSILKPYDNQVAMRAIDVDVELERYYQGKNNMLSVNMLIGFTKTQKDNWIKRYAKEEDVIINSSDMISWRSGQIKKRKLAKKIESVIKDGARGLSIVLIGDNFLSKENRSIFLDFFSSYNKCAIVYEKDLEKMYQVGYERPTMDEGFDDFTYHIS